MVAVEVEAVVFIVSVMMANNNCVLFWISVVIIKIGLAGLSTVTLFTTSQPRTRVYEIPSEEFNLLGDDVHRHHLSIFSHILSGSEPVVVGALRMG